MRIVHQTEVEKMKKNLKNNLPKEIVRAINLNDFQVVDDWSTVDTINLVDNDGRSAVFHAILVNSIDIISVLLKKEAALNIKDFRGWYPLHYAAQNYLPKVVNMLIENGALLEVKDDYGNTPLWRAVFASEGRGDVIKLLLLKGADPHNPNNSGVTPYKLAHSIANYDVRQFFE